MNAQVNPQISDASKYQLLVDSITDYAIYLLDADGHVVSWNSGARRFKGYEEAEVLGSHFSRFYTPEDQAAGLPRLALATAAEQGKYEAEGWRVRKDGTRISRFWAHVVIDAIRDEQGQLLGFAKITRDITERVETQRSLNEAREALFQAQKMEAVGQLTGGVAHDFNNLLTAVMGSLELLRKRIPADPRVTALLDNAMLGIHRGAALTQRMLAFARRQDLHTSSTSMMILVHEMSGLLEKSLGPLMRLEMRFPATLPPVEADANQLETAVLNLALNARDAMPNGGTILISGHQESVGLGHVTRLKPGQYVCLSVSDSGHGMDEAVLSRAIEPFYTTKGVGKGTGLGLSMIHGMAEQSGGRLMLRSMRGIGTTAEIWLPVSDRPLEAEKSESVPLVPVLPALKILVVDDDELVLNNMVQMLEDAGHSITSASSGSAALEVLKSQDQIDVLLTDHAMPELTGVQLATEALRQRPALPVLLVSGYAEIPGRIDSRIRRLAKPFSQAELLEGIAGVLPRKRG